VAESLTDPFIAVTDSIVRRLAHEGEQTTVTLREWAAPYSVSLEEWLEWALRRRIVELLYGGGINDPSARWALSADRVAEYAVEQAATRTPGRG